MVEDAPINLEVGTGMLEALGCRVESACNGVEALEAVARKNYDLVLMDCQMPVMDGYQATRKLRELEQRQGRGAATGGAAPKRLTIIALTAHAMPNDRQLCLDAGMDDYLAKPFSKAGLGAVLFRWLPLVAPDDASLGGEPPLAIGATGNGDARASAAQPGSGPWIIDTERLDELRSLQRPGNPDLLEKIIRQYLAEGVALIEQIRAGFAAGDAARVQDACHRFKSSSAFVGATRLAKLCEELDQICRGGGLPGDCGYLAGIEEGYREAASSLRPFLTESAV